MLRFFKGGRIVFLINCVMINGFFYVKEYFWIFDLYYMLKVIIKLDKRVKISKFLEDI